MACGTMQRLVFARIMLCAKWIRSADTSAIQRLAQEPLEILRFAQLDQATQRAVGICCCRVYQEARLVFSIFCLSVDPFANTGSIVATLERKLSDPGS